MMELSYQSRVYGRFHSSWYYALRAHCTCTPMARKEFLRTQLTLFSFRSPLRFCFGFVLSRISGCCGIWFARASKSLAWGKLMCSFYRTFTSLFFVSSLVVLYRFHIIYACFHLDLAFECFEIILGDFWRFQG